MAGVHVGSSPGMYPAVEITLRLDHVHAAERPSPTALGSAFRDLHVGTNLLPLQAARKTSPGCRRSLKTDPLWVSEY
jgi:hypothetical protein